MMIPVTFWIKSRLIIIVKKMNKFIKLPRKLQSNVNILINIKQYQAQHYFVHLTNKNITNKQLNNIKQY